MLAFLRRQRSQLDDQFTREGRGHTLSLPRYLLHRHTLELIHRHARSPCLDAGAGRSPWKPTLAARGIEVLSLDVEQRGTGVDLIADLQEMPTVATASMRTVLCTQVLEHLPRPWDAVAEIARVLVEGGHLILSVPHLSVIHEAPSDYYRYTRYGLASLLASRGLAVVEMRESGGLISFLAHGVSMALLCSLGALPGLRRAVWLLNYLLVVRLVEPLDAVFGLRKIYPCDYVVLARKEKS